MSTDLDRRLNAFSPELADARLKGQVEAARFVEGEPARIIEPVVRLFPTAQHGAIADTELLMGEAVRVFETTDEGWAWVQSDVDDYVGWCAASALGPVAPEPTHRVTALWTHLYAAPHIKTPPAGFAPLNAHLSVEGTAAGSSGTAAGGAAASAERFVKLADGRFAISRHLAPLDASPPTDFIGQARKFIGTPYMWAGRTARGIDCSGLVQMGLAACGVKAPRDSDMQERGLGTPVNESDPGAWQRGDLVFWKGHVGIVSEPGTLLHANAHHMATVEEPLGPAVERIAGAGLQVTSVKRL
ncbi:NlpC/P60 family protein [Tepidamorphus sp. 3E244]|uniref:C40 family peptidase n=1 Tax=Tepidamorphus sp. 3E244 TaxID=3385498 RepID=UPI0038FC3DBA